MKQCLEKIPSGLLSSVVISPKLSVLVAQKKNRVRWIHLWGRLTFGCI